MFCDDCNALTNVGGVMGLQTTRPLASFFLNPHTAFLAHWNKPHDGTPPRVTVPPGPQARPAFIVAPYSPAPVYAPPAFVDDGWVPGGVALRLGA